MKKALLLINLMRSSISKIINLASKSNGSHASLHFFAKLLFTALLLAMALPGQLLAQAPTISYSSPHTYAQGTAITPLVPTSSGVTGPAYGGPVTIIPGIIEPTSNIAADIAGNLYFADPANGTIKKIPAGSTTPVTIASGFSAPGYVALDAAGNVYVLDGVDNAAYEVPAGGGARVLLGSGFISPGYLAVDPAGNVYVSDWDIPDNTWDIIKIPVGGGTPVALNLSAYLFDPHGLAVDASGNIFVTSGTVDEFVAGIGPPQNSYTSNYPVPLNLALDPAGNLFSAQLTLISHTVFESVIEIPAGTTSGSGYFIDLMNGFNFNPISETIDGAGNLYIAYLAPSGLTAVSELKPLGGYYISRFLPAGLSFDTATGTISGTPTAANPPTNYTITAYNNAGASSSATVNISVTSNMAGNANLANLTPGNGTLSPAFASGTTSYTDTVSNISSLIVIPTTSDPNATVKINGTTVAQGSSASIPLTAGQNTITTIVTAADGTTTKTYTITVILIPYINAGPPAGVITACIGSASFSPNIQQFTVSGSALTGDITATAPTNFEVSLAPGSGYGSNVTLSQSGGVVNTTTVYVRSAASAPTGGITGNVTLTSAGALSQNVTVRGNVNAIPTVNPVANQTVNNGAATAAVNFTGPGGFSWVNNTPGIGLAASGFGNIPSFTAINAGSSPVTATVTVTPLSTTTGYAYIPNHDANNVSVINTATNTVVATIPVGAAPFGVAATPDGSTVYIANSNSTFISVISTNTNTVVNTIPTGLGPFTLVVSPDGSTLYAVVYNNVAVINTATNAVTDLINVFTGSTGISITPDGSRLYVGNSITGNVTVINTVSKTVIATIPVGNPIAIAVTLDGKKVFVTNSGSNIISVIDAVTNTVVSTISTPSLPNGIVLSPDGSKAYVATSSPSVLVLNTATNAVIATIPSPAGELYGISISPDGSTVYASSLFGSVVAISTATNTVTATIPVGALPYSLGNFVTRSAACSGTPVTFTITVNPTTASNNANLTNLTLSNGSLTPVFASGTTSYTASVGNLITAITLTPTTSDPAATVTVNGVTVASGSPSAGIPLLVGANTITTIVTAQDGTTTKTYTVIVTRAGGTTNAGLTYLKISKGTLSPAFVSGTTSYTANVSNATTSITVTPTAADPTAIITVNGLTTASGSPSPGLPVAVGPNTITIVVTKDSTAVSYTLTVNRGPSENALLANLQLSKGTLSPAFASGTFSYTARAGRTTTGITVTPTTADAAATVTVNGIAVTSGTASPTIPLSAGVNNITIVVTAQNGTVSKIYSLAVTKEAGTVASLFETVSVADETGSDQPAADGIKVHQAVSPNGDGLNDVLLIDGITAYPENKLLIVNRNGSLIFETQGYNNITRVFDGHSNQNGAMQLPGTYFYSLEYKVGDETRHNTGFFVLKY